MQMQRIENIAVCYLLLMPYPTLLSLLFLCLSFSLCLSFPASLPLCSGLSLSLSLSLTLLPPLSLSYHLFSLPGLGSFYCLKGTLLTTHICPFIILRGLFYSCPGTVADADRCLATSNRSEKASAGSAPERRAEREAHPCQFCNSKKCGGGQERMDKKKGCEGEQSEIYQREDRWRQQKEIQKMEGGRER